MNREHVGSSLQEEIVMIRASNKNGLNELESRTVTKVGSATNIRSVSFALGLIESQNHGDDFCNCSGSFCGHMSVVVCRICCDSSALCNSRRYSEWKKQAENERASGKVG